MWKMDMHTSSTSYMMNIVNSVPFKILLLMLLNDFYMYFVLMSCVAYENYELCVSQEIVLSRSCISHKDLHLLLQFSETHNTFHFGVKIQLSFQRQESPIVCHHYQSLFELSAIIIRAYGTESAIIMDFSRVK